MVNIFLPDRRASPENRAISVASEPENSESCRILVLDSSRKVSFSSIQAFADNKTHAECCFLSENRRLLKLSRINRLSSEAELS